MSILEDGHPTRLGFALRPNVLVEEVEVTPFGVDGGDGNSMTNMRNVEWRTFAPKHLKTATPVSGLFNYSPECLTDIVFMVNKNQMITVTMPTGRKWNVWGYIKSFMPDPHKEGEKPTARIETVITNRNNSGQEVAPSLA